MKILASLHCFIAGSIWLAVLTPAARAHPTFNDADGLSMGGLRDANGGVSAMVLDGSGNLQIGGHFTIVGNGSARNVAKCFTLTGETAANYIAKWNGREWSALGSRVNGLFNALAVFGSDLFLGSTFTTAGEKVSAYLAKANLSGATLMAQLFTSIVPHSYGTQALLAFNSDPSASFHLLSATNLTTWQTSTTVHQRDGFGAGKYHATAGVLPVSAAAVGPHTEREIAS